MTDTPEESTNSTDPNAKVAAETNGDEETQQADAEATGEAQEESALEAELTEFKDKFLRAAAELENVRRRSEKERTELLKYGLEGFFKELLPVLDSFDQALPDQQDVPEGVDASFHEGMQMVKRQLATLLDKHGLESVKADGEAFDPNIHQAIQQQESSDVQQDMVGQEFQKGYLLNGRLIRPAMVSVLTAKGD